MTKTFRLEIVTPEKQAFADDVESLVVPAYEGYLGVLSGHAPLLCVLAGGKIKIQKGREEIHFATTGGFMEVTPKKAVILAESIT